MKALLRDQASAEISVEAPRNSSSLTSNIWNGRRYRIWFSLAVWLVFFWSLIELPLELWVSTTWQEASALSFAKVLLFAVVLAMMRGAAWATVVFVGMCSISVLAVTPALPAEFEFFPVGATLSTGEVVIKLLALLVVASGPSMRGR